MSEFEKNVFMKKIIITIIAALTLFASQGCARVRNDKTGKIETTEAAAAAQTAPLVALINEYKSCDGFEVVQLGRFGTSVVKSLIKAAAKSEVDEDIRDAFRIISGIKRFAVVEFDGCSSDVRNGFISKVENILGSSELLMEVKDDDDQFKMYGITSSDGGTVSNFVLYNPSDNTLICLFGTISMDHIARMME